MPSPRRSAAAVVSAVSLLLPAAAATGCTLDKTHLATCKDVKITNSTIHLGWNVDDRAATLELVATASIEITSTGYLAVGFGSTPSTMAPASFAVASFNKSTTLVPLAISMSGGISPRAGASWAFHGSSTTAEHLTWQN